MQISTETLVKPKAPATTRRGLVIAGIHAIWGAIATALAAPVTQYLLAPPKPQLSDEWIDLGNITHLPPGVPVELAFRRNRIDGWRTVTQKLTAWVVKTPDSGIVAFGPQCTHLGCAHHWDDARSQFVCPCHNSHFSIEGKVLAGPAPRPLDQFDVKVEGNRLQVGRLRQVTRV